MKSVAAAEVSVDTYHQEGDMGANTVCRHSRQHIFSDISHVDDSVGLSCRGDVFVSQAQ